MSKRNSSDDSNGSSDKRQTGPALAPAASGEGAPDGVAPDSEAVHDLVSADDAQDAADDGAQHDGQQQGDQQHDREAADSWPNLQQLVPDQLEHEVAAALVDVEAEPLFELLKQLSPRQLSYVMRVLGLRRAARVNRGMVTALLSRLRARPSQELLSFLFLHIVYAFDHAHLDDEEWETFLAGNRDELTELFNGNEALLRYLTSCERIVPVPLFRLGLAVASAECRTHVPAFAFLTLHSETAAALYEELRQQHPGLPPAPTRRLQDLLPSQVLGEMLADVTAAGEPGDPATPLEVDADEDGLDDELPGLSAVPRRDPSRQHQGADTPTDLDVEPAITDHADADTSDLDVVLALVDTLDWELTATTAAQVAEALRNGAAPDPHRVRLLLDFTDRAHRAAAALTARSGRAVAPTVVEIDDAVTGLRRNSETDELLVGLTQASGPDDLAETVDEVRELAAGALAGGVEPEVIDSLIALAKMARSAAAARRGGPTEYARIAGHEVVARAALPSGVLPAVTAALLGVLEVPERAVAARPAGGRGTAPGPELADRVDRANLDEEAAASAGVATVDGSPTGAPDAATSSDATGAPPVGNMSEDERAEESGEDVTATDPMATANSTELHTAAVATSDTLDDDSLDLSELDDFLRSPDAGILRIRDEQPPAPDTPIERAAEDEPGTDVEDREDTEDAVTADGAATKAAARDHLLDTEARLLAEQRFGLASYLHAHPAAAAARRLAAYQACITSATGALATAFGEDQALISRDLLAEDRVGQRLAWAAAARVAVVAPVTGAAAVLHEFAPCMGKYPTLVQVGQALAEASLSGATALPEHSNDLSAVTDATEQARTHIATARTLLESAPRRALKYAPANWVYQHLMSADGALGRLLATVIGSDPTNADDVRRRIVEIRRSVDRLIDATFAEVNKSSKYRRIEAGARQRLTQRIEEALDVASGWADASTAVREHKARLQGAASASRPLDKLRTTLEPLRGPARNELGRMRSAAAKGTAEGRLEAATADAVAGMVMAAFATSAGTPPSGGEPSPAWAVNAELLDSGLPLHPATLTPAAPDVEVAAAVRDLSGRPAPSYEAMYERRAECAEHDLTEVLVANLTQIDPDQAAPLLRARRDADVAKELPAVAAQIARVTDQVNSHRRDETIPEPVWSSLLAELEGMRHPQRRDFGAIRRLLSNIEKVVEDHKQLLVQQARERIERRAVEDPLVAQNRDTLLDIVDRGDVSGADEFLEQLTSGTPLPESRHDDVHLRRFFPAVPDLASRAPGLLRDLHATLGGGEPTPVVLELFDAAHVEPASATRTVGRSALGAWMQLAGRPKSGVDLGTLLKPIVAAMGLEFSGRAELDKDRPAGRQFATLRGVGGPAKAMSPVLGSDMGGPSGNSLRVLLVWGKDIGPTTLIDRLREVPPDRTVLVLYLPGALTADQRRALATAARGQARPPAIVVDAALIAYLCCQAEPSRTTLAFTTLPFTADSPYADRPGNTPEEMFYGRVGERQKVIDLAGPSFVSGGRQLGKSALLRSAEREFNKTPGQRALWLDVRQVGADGRPEALWPMLDAELRRADIAKAGADAPTSETVSHAIHTWLRADAERALLILIDEADNFLTADAADNKFDNVGACKRLMESENRRVKFVFAGLHRTSRFESLSNQPLAHMGKPIVVGPLRPQAAQDLITRPLAAMGFTFADPTVQTARILAATNSVPSLLQLFGRALIAHLTSREVGDGPPQEITDADIATVLDDPELAAEFREKYILTLNLDHRYQVIVHAVALAAYEIGVDLGLRLNDLADLCRQYWPAGFADLPIDYLRGLVTECQDLGLLTLDQGRYRMRTPYVLRLLGTAEEVAEVLFNAEERLTLPSASNAGSYRARMHNSSHRAPLTARQVGQLLDAPGQTRVVIGNEALAVQRAVHCLEQVSEEGRAAGLDIRRLKSSTPQSLVARAGRLTQPTLLLLDMRHLTAGQVEAVLEASGPAHAAASAQLTVVVVADTSSAPAWVNQADDQVALTRVDAPGLRLWAAEVDAPFHSPEELQALAAATGGWPILVERALDGTGPASSDRCLADLGDWLASASGARALVTACGLRSTDQPQMAAVLADAFAAVQEWTSGGGADLADLAELIAEDSDLVDRATTVGFSGLADVLRTLQLGGMFLTDPDTGELAAEPVLALAAAVVGTPVGATR